MKIFPINIFSAVGTVIVLQRFEIFYGNSTALVWRRMGQCTDDDNRSYRNVCNMSLITFSLAAIFIIRLFSTSAFRVPKDGLKL